MKSRESAVRSGQDVSEGIIDGCKVSKQVRHRHETAVRGPRRATSLNHAKNTTKYKCKAAPAQDDSPLYPSARAPEVTLRISDDRVRLSQATNAAPAPASRRAKAHSQAAVPRRAAASAAATLAACALASGAAAAGAAAKPLLDGGATAPPGPPRPSAGCICGTRSAVRVRSRLP